MSDVDSCTIDMQGQNTGVILPVEYRPMVIYVPALGQNAGVSLL
jgi:hypothetical protein